MPTLRPFHIIVVGIFGLLAVGGLIAFSLYRAGGGGGEGPATVVWGTAPREALQAAAVAAFGDEGAAKRIEYVEKNTAAFDAELIEALADGVGPDLILAPLGTVLSHSERLFPLSFEAYPERLFKDTFIEEAELLYGNGGIFGLPLAVDPLIMYWNRDLFTAAGLPLPPRQWDETLLLVGAMLRRDDAGNITTTPLALGEYKNVTNAKEILSAIFLQSGVPVLERGAHGGLQNALAATTGAVSALGFYTDFANPVKVTYAWNRALPPSEFMFRSGRLGLYFGFASEIEDLRARNPNLNFDVALLPQPRGAKIPVTFGNLYAVAALKNSRNLGGAVKTMLDLSAPAPALSFASGARMAPSRRDLLVKPPSSAAADVFYRSALISRGFADVNPGRTGEIFAGLIEDVTTGRETLGRAIENAGRKIEEMLR